MNQFEMKQRAYRSELKNRALQVLLYLIDRSNKESTCFPAIPTIGRELHISISTVKRALGELVEAGFIVKESRFRANMGQTSNLYTIVFPEVKNSAKEITFEGLAEEIKCQEQQAAEERDDQVKEDNSVGETINENESIVPCYCGNRVNATRGVSLKISWTGVEANLIPP